MVRNGCNHNKHEADTYHHYSVIVIVTILSRIQNALVSPDLCHVITDQTRTIWGTQVVLRSTNLSIVYPIYNHLLQRTNKLIDSQIGIGFVVFIIIIINLYLLFFYLVYIIFISHYITISFFISFV